MQILLIDISLAVMFPSVHPSFFCLCVHVSSFNAAVSQLLLLFFLNIFCIIRWPILLFNLFIFFPPL